MEPTCFFCLEPNNPSKKPLETLRVQGCNCCPLVHPECLEQWLVQFKSLHSQSSVVETASGDYEYCQEHNDGEDIACPICRQKQIINAIESHSPPSNSPPTDVDLMWNRWASPKMTQRSVHDITWFAMAQRMESQNRVHPLEQSSLEYPENDQTNDQTNSSFRSSVCIIALACISFSGFLSYMILISS